MEDIIRKRVADQINQITQARMQSATFDPRSTALRSEAERRARLSGLTRPRDLNTSQLSSLRHGIPGLAGYPESMSAAGQQHRALLPGLYDNGIGLMDLVSAQQGMQHEDDILRGLRDPQQWDNRPLAALMTQGKDHYQGHNPIRPHSRLFSNQTALLDQNTSRSAISSAFNEPAARERALHNDALDGVGQSLSQAMSRDAMSNIMNQPSSMSTVDEIVRKLTNNSSSLPMGSRSPTPSDPQDVASGFGSFQLRRSIPLAMPTDKDWITPLHCFVRRHCVELFTASPSDIIHRSSKGKRRPIHVGRVGIRCPHCHKSGNNSLGASSGVGLNKGSVYFPTTIASVYNATMNLLQRHMHVCENVPPEIMSRYNELKADDARSGTSKKYWIESAKALGLIDTPNGIQFSTIGVQRLPHAAKIFSTDHGASPESNLLLLPKAISTSSIVGGENSLFSDIEGGPLVAPEYKYLATAYSYALLSQMQACVFTEADRLGKRKGLPLGFAGLACRHCYGGYGSGRFFPSNIKTMSDASKTLNVLHSHMMRCRKCPSRVKVGLQTLRLGHDEERSKMKFGSQKAFFVNIWKRLHGERPLDGRKVSNMKKQSMVETSDEEKKSPEVKV